MDSTTWKRAKQIFNEALEKSGPERNGFVAAACGQDKRLRAQVQALLKAHAEAGEFLTSPTVAGADEAARAAATLSSSPPAERPGTTIGPYKLLQVIGEGGFGLVYMAEQEEPVRRRVALKIIKLGMDTNRVIARFEAERQALALMEHPNIARVLDAGATDTGRPYFVMELVKGVPITEYCDTNRLSTHERLALFREVCAAVQHAHQKGIIHRDLKPSNVLVTLHDGKPVPRVIDFGISKATNQRLTEKTLFTEYGQFIGTPAYMSPEQAEMSGLDVDTRSDIYSLGVLLYELLTATTPFDAETLRRAGYGELQRIIREVDPPRPSTRLSTLGGALTDVAKRRKIDPRGLSRLLRGELDWIVMKALEKERGRRYDSPGEFAADIARHLRHEPVTAGPPGAVYRARKLIRRHRALVGFASAVLLLLAGWAVSVTVQSSRIAKERDRANREAEKATEEAATAKRVSEFLVDLFGATNPREARGKTVTAKDILDEGAGRIHGELASEPLIQAQLMSTMGRAYGRLGLYEVAESMLDRALRIQADVLGDEDQNTLGTKSGLAGVYLGTGRQDEAEKLFVEVLETNRRAFGDEHKGIIPGIVSVGLVRGAQGRVEEAEELFREALERSRHDLGDDHLETLRCLKQLADLQMSRGKYAEAEEVYLEVFESRREMLGSDHPDTFFVQAQLARLYKRQGRYDEAERMLVEALGHTRRVRGYEHRSTLRLLSTLGRMYEELGRADEAEKMYVEALERVRGVLGDEHPQTLNLMNDLGWLYNELGRADEAEGLHVEALETRRRVLGEDHPQTLWSKYNLAWVRELQGRTDEAERLFRETLETRRRLLGKEHADTLWSKDRLARIYDQQGRHDEAERLHREALEGRRRTLGDSNPDTIRSMNSLAWLLLTREPPAARDPQGALAMALEASERTDFSDPDYLDTLALAYHLTGDAEKAVETQNMAIWLVPETDTQRRREFEGRLREFEKAVDGTPR
jgi:serine/threonine protein kinase/tetratricopeptide (TPR) repeat protein